MQGIRVLVTNTLAGYALVSSLLVFPHSLSYFNELAGGPLRGVHHLSNSNIDWGQDLLLLQQWKQDHIPDEPLFLAYFGRIHPIYAAIDFKVPPVRSENSPFSATYHTREDLEPGWYAISVTLLQGRAYILPLPSGGWGSTSENDFSYFNSLTPVARVGYSIFVYRVLPKREYGTTEDALLEASRRIALAE